MPLSNLLPDKLAADVIASFGNKNKVNLGEPVQYEQVGKPDSLSVMGLHQQQAGLAW